MGTIQILGDGFGGKVLAYGGYWFGEKCRLESGETEWSCLDETCEAFAKTLGRAEGFTVTSGSKWHNHSELLKRNRGKTSGRFNINSSSILSMPTGSGSMLRSRRSGVSVKPNRVLDKGSSRGMIYENEDLRLRNINFNEELDKRHNDIKRLKRENEHLRREIWTLREELYRLEHERNQEAQEDEEEEDEEEETEEEEEEEVDEEDEKTGLIKRRDCDKLSTVNEEPEDTVSSIAMPSPPRSPSIHVVEVKVEEPRRMAVPSAPPPIRPPLPPKDPTKERSLEEYQAGPPPCLRINSVHPFTAAASIDPFFLPNLSSVEVIEEVTRRCKGVVGVRMLHRSVFISCSSKSSLDELLASGLTLRDTPLALYDVSQGTVVVALSGVPHHLSDADLAQVLAQYGPVISGVERRLYRDVDTGERLARLRPVSSIPKRVFIQGSELLMRALTHEELSKLSMVATPPKPNLQLKIDPTVTSDGGPPTQGSSGSATRSELLFPTSSTTSINSLHPPLSAEERCHSAPVVGGPSASPLTVKKGHSDSEVKKERPRIRRVSRKMSRQEPSSSSEQESPNKPRRRRSSVFAPPGYGFETRDRSASMSSRASVRRKMSVTGRETGKIPWCACWGNGCF